jgi:hypothetical protein
MVKVASTPELCFTIELAGAFLRSAPFCKNSIVKETVFVNLVRIFATVDFVCLPLFDIQCSSLVSEAAKVLVISDVEPDEKQLLSAILSWKQVVKHI